MSYTSHSPARPTDDHGNDKGTATTIGVPSRTAGDLEHSADVDVFRFRLGSWSPLTVETVGGTDTLGELHGPNGLRWTSDDAGLDRNFRIRVEDAPAGDYYVIVQPYIGHSGQYELRVTSGLPILGDDHGDSEYTATRISVPSTTTGDLEESDDRDVFRFRLDSSASLIVETTGGTDTVGELFGPDGPMGSDDDSGSDSNFWIVANDAPAGDYYVVVSGYGTTTRRYEFHVSVDDSPFVFPITGVWWEVTQPPDFFISDSQVGCGRDSFGDPGPGVYVSWDPYPEAEYFDLHYRRPDRAPDWLDVGSFDGVGVLVDPDREEVCFEHWGFGVSVKVDLRLRAVLYDGSTSDWYTILNIQFPPNPFSAATGQIADEEGEVATSHRAGARRPQQ